MLESKKKSQNKLKKVKKHTDTQKGKAQRLESGKVDKNICTCGTRRTARQCCISQTDEKPG